MSNLRLVGVALALALGACSARSLEGYDTGGGGSSGGGAGGVSSGGVSSGGAGGSGASDAGNCKPSEIDCAGACLDPETHNSHCGSCGNACAGGTACQAGKCTCPLGQELCNGQCVDPLSSPANCGACGNECTAAQVCATGKCATSCDSGQTVCGGACVSTQTSNSNCGSCGNACSGGKTCSSGSCSCPSSQTSCNGTCVSTQTSNSNCGVCGKVCPSVSSCQSGNCVCSGGQTLCGSSCVSTQTSNSNCGGCGKVCSGGTTCTAGSCVKPAVCGDGTLESGEQCDDGNTTGGDGCSATCQVVCTDKQATAVPYTATPSNRVHCYWRVGSTNSWKDTAGKCATSDGHLVSITSSGENAFVLSLTPAGSTRIWIGGTDGELPSSATHGTYVWETGQAMSYLNWASGEPNWAACGTGCYEHRVALKQADGKWEDRRDTESGDGICEWEPKP